MINTNVTPLATLSTIINQCPKRIAQVIQPYLNEIPSAELKHSMKYAMEAGGKYIRPTLLYLTGLAFGASWEQLDAPAAAIEMIHTYSLIHDDLPCMDNADLRRGRPTCHKQFGEAMAVLTGDALHSLAMHLVVSHSASLSMEQRANMAASLSKACGPYGMAAGQAWDITRLSTKLSIPELLHIYELKTSALFLASLELGWIAAPNTHISQVVCLRHVAYHLGIAFQIQDDVLDVEATSDISGKPQGLDAQNQKITYATLFGLKEAKEAAARHYAEALDFVKSLGDEGKLLTEFIHNMAAR